MVGVRADTASYQGSPEPLTLPCQGPAPLELAEMLAGSKCSAGEVPLRLLASQAGRKRLWEKG